MADHRPRECGHRFFRDLDRAGGEKLIVGLHEENVERPTRLRKCYGEASVQRPMLSSTAVELLKQQGRCRTIDMNRSLLTVVFVVAAAAAVTVSAETPNYSLFVSNERSGDVTVIDGSTDVVVTTFPVGKRPRGIHATPDGTRVFVTLSGSPRMAPGVDTERAPADKTADGLGVIDPVAHKLIDRWHIGSDPEQFAISRDGKFAFIANEDDATASIVDLSSGQSRGRVKVSEEPEGVGVNPANGEVYVTCEEKGEVFAIAPDEQRVIAKIDTGGRPRSVAFLPDGSRAYVACESGGYVAVIDAASRKLVSKIQLPKGSLPMGTAMSPDGKNPLHLHRAGKRRCNHRHGDEFGFRHDSSWKSRLGHRAQSRWLETLHGQWRVGRCVGCRSKIGQGTEANQSG